MDQLAQDLRLEDEIEAVMRREGVDRAEAITIVALRFGQVHGDGDLVSVRPLTDDEQERAGLSHTLDQVLAAQRARTRSG